MRFLIVEFIPMNEFLPILTLPPITLPLPINTLSSKTISCVKEQLLYTITDFPIRTSGPMNTFGIIMQPLDNNPDIWGTINARLLIYEYCKKPDASISLFTLSLSVFILEYPMVFKIRIEFLSYKSPNSSKGTTLFPLIEDASMKRLNVVNAKTLAIPSISTSCATNVENCVVPFIIN